MAQNGEQSSLALCQHATERGFVPLTGKQRQHVWFWMHFVLHDKTVLWNIHSSFVIGWDVCNVWFDVFLSQSVMQDVCGHTASFRGVRLLSAFQSGFLHLFSASLCTFPSYSFLLGWVSSPFLCTQISVMFSKSPIFLKLPYFFDDQIWVWGHDGKLDVHLWFFFEKSL